MYDDLSTKLPTTPHSDKRLILDSVLVRLLVDTYLISFEISGWLNHKMIPCLKETWSVKQREELRVGQQNQPHCANVCNESCFPWDGIQKLSSRKQNKKKRKHHFLFRVAHETFATCGYWGKLVVHVVSLNWIIRINNVVIWMK